MNKGTCFLLLQSFLLIVGLFASGATFSATEFSCNVNAVNSKGKAPNTSGTKCVAIVAYVNGDTEEQQNVLRHCKITGKSTSCTASYDDADITVTQPFTAGILNVSSLDSLASNLSSQGCLDTSVNRNITGAPESSMLNITLTYNLLCP